MLYLVLVVLLVIVGVAFLAFLAMKVILVMLAILVAAIYVGSYLLFAEVAGFAPLASIAGGAIAGTLLIVVFMKVSNREPKIKHKRDYWDNGYAAKMLKKLESNDKLTQEQKIYLSNEYALKKMRASWWQFWV